MYSEELFEKLPYWTDLTPDEQARVKRCAVVKEFAKGELLYSQGNECLGMSVVLSGKIRVYVVSEEGREITLFSMGADDTCVLSASCVLTQITFDTLMMASENSRVLVVPAHLFESLMDENINVRCYAFELLSKRASTIMWVFENILFYGLDQRLARYLVEESERNSSSVIHETQEVLAQNINSAREAVARQLARFADDGLVIMGRGRVEILDMARLKEIIG